MFMEDLDLFLYDNLYDMCMLICDISAVYFCMLNCDFVESTIVCRNKSPTGLMLCHVSHIRRKINFLYLFCICIYLSFSRLIYVATQTSLICITVKSELIYFLDAFCKKVGIVK